MKLSDFDYILPKELIAQYPLEERDSARLLVLDRKKARLEHRSFKDITGYLGRDDLLVLNNTKVLPSRLRGKRLSGGKVEVLLLERKKDLSFNALIKPSRLKLGEKIIFTPLEAGCQRQPSDASGVLPLTGFNNGTLSAFLSARGELTFLAKDLKDIYSHGVTPLPPYIKREPDDLDNIYYQTIYAKEEGAIASPTAGLHFTDQLMHKIKAKGVNTSYITLHVGYGTFKPVKSEDVASHKMDREEFIAERESLEIIRAAKKNGKKVIGVGTTTVRALETIADRITDYALPITDYHDFTEFFIYPGYKFKIIDCLLTNFHLPRTTLYMLVCAFATKELARMAYQEAIDKKYRFYSYGDAMLII